ncbi:hypothetical protein [Oscillibacter sp. 1-3]|nr:hypothetical protein [Oscillibacter sp. 1-3]
MRKIPPILLIPKTTARSLYTLVQSINCSATLLQFVSIAVQSPNAASHS